MNIEKNVNIFLICLSLSFFVCLGLYAREKTRNKPTQTEIEDKARIREYLKNHEGINHPRACHQRHTKKKERKPEKENR